MVNGKIQEHDSIPTNKMGFTSRRSNNDLFTIDQYGVISKFQMGGPHSLPIQNSYSPKVISSSQGNLRTQVNPSQVISRQSQPSLYSHTNTLTPTNTNYLQPTQPTRIISNQSSPNPSNLSTYIHSPSNQTIYNPIPQNQPTYNPVNSSMSQHVRRYTPTQSGIYTPNQSLNSIPVQGTAQNPIPLNQMVNRYSKENQPPVTIQSGIIQHVKSTPSYQPLPPRVIQAPVPTQSLAPATIIIRVEPQNTYIQSPSNSPPLVQRSNQYQYSPVNVVDRQVENGVVQPLQYSSISNNYRERRDNKLDSHRDPNRKRSYLIGRPLKDPSDSRNLESVTEKPETNNYFSIYGRGQNFDSKKIYDAQGSPSYNSNQISYLRNNSHKVIEPQPVKRISPYNSSDLNNIASPPNRYHNPSGLSKISEKDLEYSEMIQPRSPVPVNQNNSPSGSTEYQSRPVIDPYRDTSPIKPENKYVSPPRSNINSAIKTLVDRSSPSDLNNSNPPQFGIRPDPINTSVVALPRDGAYTEKDRIIHNAMNPKKFQTGFECCINLIPVLPEFGYVNCMSGNQNCVAQYEIMDDGKIKQTEILKSKYLIHFLKENYLTFINLLAGEFYDGIFLKERLKAYMIEGTTASIIQIEPDVEQPEYFVIGKSIGVDGPNRCLKVNKNETCLLINEGKQIQVWEIGLGENRGIRKAGIAIKMSNLDPEVIIEDYLPLKDKGVIITDSTGLIEIFLFNLQNKTFAKLSEFDLNEGVEKPEIFEQITNMCLDEEEQMLAIATARSTTEEGTNQLTRLVVFKVDIKGRPHPLCQKRFTNESPNSMYFYLNFEYTYKGVPLLYAFQNEDTMRLDVFGINDSKLGLIHSQHKYHSTDFSAIRSINGKLISIDYDGVMRVMEVPEE